MSETIEKPMPSASTARRATLSKPERSRLVLTSTGGIICGVLFVWLLALHFFPRAAGDQPILSMALAPPPAVPLQLMTTGGDAQALGGGREKTVADLGRLEEELDRFLDAHKNKPVMIHLAGLAATWTEGVEPRTYLLTGGEGLNGGLEPVPLEQVVDRVVRKGKTTLLVLDLAQNGSDRTLPAFVLDLAALDVKNRPLSVLLSCAPGQQSWVSESQGVSVFAHYLDEALRANAGEVISARDLLAYVGPRVAHWVREHRGAVQTPMLLGDAGARLSIPSDLRRVATEKPGADAEAEQPEPEPEPAGGEGAATEGGKAKAPAAAEEKKKGREPPEVRGPATAPARPETREEAVAAVLQEWGERARMLEESGERAIPPPYRNAPVPWRSYQETLLHAERLARVGDLGGVDLALKQARVYRSQVEQQQAGLPISRPWSLALARRPDADGPQEPEQFEEAVGRLLEELQVEPRPAAAEPKAEGQEASADPKAPADGPSPLEMLTGSRSPASAVPYYVEAQVPVWYARFVDLGAESPELRASRVALIRRAVAVREVAERAAGLDDRAVEWVRDVVDQADQKRREGQDRLFAADRENLETSRTLLDEADRLYAGALALARARVDGLDLLDRLRDELPYQGDWLSRRPRPIDPDLLDLIARAEGLAGVVEADAPPQAEADASARELRGQVDDLADAYDRFLKSAQGQIEVLARQGNWREVDALLHLPTLAVEKREALLRRAGSTELSPAFDEASSLADLGEPEPDPTFWNQALNQATVELGLLRLAGLDEPDATLKVARASWKDEPDRAIAELARITQHIRERRRDLFAQANAEAPSGESAPARAARLKAAARAARTLPQARLRDLEENPVQDLQDHRRRELIVWHAGRLDDDFSLPRASQVLAELEGNRSEEARKVAERISERSLASIKVDFEGQPARARFVGRGAWPSGGLASAFALKPGGAAPLGSSLLAVADLDVRLDLEGAARPAAFFRGWAYVPRSASTPVAGDVVSVKIAQTATRVRLPLGRRNRPDTIDFPDQFKRNHGRAYLHPVNSLDYKLLVTNTSDQPVTVCIRHGLESLPPANRDKMVLTLAPHQTDETTVGTVRPADLPDIVVAPAKEGGPPVKVETPANLIVEVTENDLNGRRLAEPLEVPFTKIEPEAPQDVTAVPSWASPVFNLEVTNTQDNRVTFPAFVYVLIAPANAVSQIDTTSPYVPLGKTARFQYQLIEPVEELTWKVYVDEILVMEGATQILARMKKNAPPAAVPPGLGFGGR